MNNNTIKLRSGQYLDLLHPSPLDFTFKDICAVCRICRYGGHCSRWYSVGEHLIHCANTAKELGYNIDCQKAVFFHDAQESFIGDCVKPLKEAMPIYQDIESQHEKAISEKFGIDFEKYYFEIKQIDLAMLIAEKNILFKADGVRWYYEDKAIKVDFKPKFWNPDECEKHFIEKAIELGINVYE